MTAPLKIKEAVVVEGRYDKSALAGVVDTLILDTAGFGVFKDGERLALLRKLAEKRGLIVLTDPDGAGFVIRNYLKGAIPKEQLKHAYVPDVYGKERRKRAPGKEGKLGVEGMPPEVLRDAILRAGVTVLDADAAPRTPGNLTPADLFALGLSGTPDAAERRAALLKRLDLPERMSAKALLAALNALYTPEEIGSFFLKEKGTEKEPCSFSRTHKEPKRTNSLRQSPLRGATAADSGGRQKG